MQLIHQTGLLREKLQQIPTAIVHCYGSGFVKLGATLAHTLQVDDDGILWLYTDRPVDCISSGNEGESFDVALNYYQQGCPFDLDIIGECWLINPAEAGRELPEFANELSNKGKLLLKVKLMDVDYSAHRPAIIDSILDKVLHVFSRHSNRHQAQEIYPGHKLSA